MPGLVDVRRDNGVAVIVIDNPPVNALKQRACGRLWSTRWRKPATTKQYSAVVLACAGRTFIAGADITEFGKPPKRARQRRCDCRTLDAMTKPVVAALHGTALGGGLEVALGCHFRVAAPASRLGPSGDQARPHPGRWRHAAAAAADRHGKSAADDLVRRADRRQGGAGCRPRRCHRRRRRDSRGGRVCPQACCRQNAAASSSRSRRQNSRSMRADRAKFDELVAAQMQTVARTARACGGQSKALRGGHRAADRSGAETRTCEVHGVEGRRPVESPAPYIFRRARGVQDRRPAERCENPRHQARRSHRRRHHGRRHCHVFCQCRHSGDHRRSLERSV